MTVADPDGEAAYVPALELAGFVLQLHEQGWYGHRLLRHIDPRGTPTPACSRPGADTGA